MGVDSVVVVEHVCVLGLGGEQHRKGSDCTEQDASDYLLAYHLIYSTKKENFRATENETEVALIVARCCGVVVLVRDVGEITNPTKHRIVNYENSD